MGAKVEMNSVLEDLDTWTTAEMLILRADLIRRLERTDDLAPFIQSMAKQFALQFLENNPEFREIQAEVANGIDENRQHKLELDALRNEVQRLRDEAEQRNLRQRQYIEKVERTEADLEKLEKVLPWDMLGTLERPASLDPDYDWENIEWDNTQVGVSLFLRNTADPRRTQVWTVTGVFDGHINEAIKEITPQILYAIFRLPSISDFSGKPTWLEDKQALFALKTLTYCRYMKPSAFKPWRRALFNALWHDKKDTAYQAARKNAMDSFYTFVDRTLANREARIDQSTVAF